MRATYLAIASVLSFSFLAGCAAGLQAETSYPPFALPNSPETLRVRILFGKSPSRLDATGPFQFRLRKGGKLYEAKASTRVRAMRSAMVFGSQSFKGDVVAIPTSSSDILKLNGRRYRGILIFHPLGSGRYDVVEYVNMEEYLYGVLPREVEPSWPLDALKAQAIVSRTYALSNKMTDANERFDVSNSVLDQVYGGLEVEAPESNSAVDQTKGAVLMDANGKPVQAFFHSSCGGRTELPEHVLKSSNAGDCFGVVSDTFCEGDPHYKWQLSLSYSSIRERLRRAGIRVRPIKKITIVQKSDSGRADFFGLQTDRGVVEVQGNRFRLA